MSDHLDNLLLTSDNFNEYEQQLLRTSVFPPKYPDIDRIIDVIARCCPPGTKLPRLQQTSCAVVGNGDVVLRNEWGKDIDNHDIVIRMNEIQLDGLESCVGRKTTIHLFNEPRSQLFADGQLNSHGHLTVFLGPSNEYHAVEIYVRFMKDTRRNNVFLFKPSFRLSISDMHPGLPSTGFASVIFARAIAKSVDLYGFNISAETGVSRYFGDRYFDPVYHRADFEYEQYASWQGEYFNIHC